MSRYCAKCGKELSDSASFCPGCGNQINGTSTGQADLYSGVSQGSVSNLYSNMNNQQAVTKKNVSKKGIFIGLGAVAVVAIAVILIVVFSGGKYYRGISWDMTMKEIATKEKKYVTDSSASSLTLRTDRKPDSNFVDSKQFLEKGITYRFVRSDVPYYTEIRLRYLDSKGDETERPINGVEGFVKFAEKKWGKNYVQKSTDKVFVARDDGSLIMTFREGFAYMRIYNPQFNDKAWDDFH